MSEPTPWDESVCNREIHAEIGGWPPTGGQNPTRQARHNAETGVTPLKAMFENQLMRVSSFDRLRFDPRGGVFISFDSWLNQRTLALTSVLKCGTQSTKKRTLLRRSDVHTVMSPAVETRNGPADTRPNEAGGTLEAALRPLVAVLVAVRNGERYLSRQTDSLARQESVRIDLWISDDGSHDASVDVIRRVADSWALGRVELVEGPQRGFAENFRSLITRADIEADFYAFCDQDDVWDEDKLAHAVEWLNTQAPGHPALYCSRTRIISADGEAIGQSQLFPRAPSFRNAIVQSIAGGNTMVMNRAAREIVMEASRRTGFVSHDWWCYLIVSGAGGSVYYCPDPRIGYRQHDDNLVGQNNTWRARMSRLGFLIRGRFKDWNDANLAGLTACADLLTDDARRVLSLFQESRSRKFPGRLVSLWRSGVYRQTALGELGLYLACVIGRL